MNNCIIVTGGAGFIGSNFVLDWIQSGFGTIVNLDKLTYAGNLATLATLETDPRHIFVHGDIGDQTLVDDLLSKYRPRAIINFAAESHVDRSILKPSISCLRSLISFSTSLLIDENINLNPPFSFSV